MTNIYLFFLLFNIFSISLSFIKVQNNQEKNSLGNSQRIIEFNGYKYSKCISKGVNEKHDYVALYLDGTFTGFTKAYTFTLYLYRPSYVYLICTIPTGSNTRFECDLEIEKFYILQGAWLPEEFPKLDDDIQVLKWDKVTKNMETNECYPRIHTIFEFTTIYSPICDSVYTYINYFNAEGTLTDLDSYFPMQTNFDFSIPAAIDDKETGLYCYIYKTEGTISKFQCKFNNSGKKLSLFDTLVYRHNHRIHFKITSETKLINCENPDRRVISFITSNYSCTEINSRMNLYIELRAYISGFFEEEKFIIPVENPSYAYIECIIPRSPATYSEEGKLIKCIYDIVKFPIHIDTIYLPSNITIIDCEVSNSEKIVKKLRAWDCDSKYSGDIFPRITDEPRCVKDDYNMILFSSKIKLNQSENHYIFDLNVLIDGKNDVLPCEVFTRSFYNETYFPVFCFSNKGNGTISFFETDVLLNNGDIASFFVDLDKKIKLNICSITEKTIFLENINIVCSNEGNQYFVIAQLYAKISRFTSDYSFNLYLDSPSTYYMSCTIPSSKSDIKELTYIECKLDILKFPLINKTSIYLPSQLPLEGINIINWDKMIKEYNCSHCNPNNFSEFNVDEYLETSCYKPYYNKISIKGKIDQKGKNYSFEMNSFVDGQISLLPCELYSLDENSSDYQLDCITNGTNSTIIYNTFVTDYKSKELIYINDSHLFPTKECIPTKFITFNKIESECLYKEKLFKIYFYADIEGFSDEVIFNVYLEKPTYIYMKCTIPKSGVENKYISCIIDVGKYPLISINEITFPSEFYIHPECQVINWEKMPKKYSIDKCSTTYQYTFNPIKYLTSECYLNGYNSFIVEGLFDVNNNTNINKLNFYKIKFNVYVYSESNNIPCEIYLPDASNLNSRLYCHSPYKNNIQIYSNITEVENTTEKIFINIDHIFNITSCPQHNKMIFFKGIQSECLLNESSLKILIYSDLVGFNNQERININLNYPNPSYLQCIIPKTNARDYIECTLDISKFPLISKNKIKMPDTFPIIMNCYLSNWININKEINTGKCYNDNYSLVFTSNKTYESKCYEKNYNAITLIGSLSVNGERILDIKKIYAFYIFSFSNGIYYNIKCEIFPPDSSFSEHRMFCYTNQINSITIFQTIVNENNSQEKLFINITNFDFNLYSCSYNDKFVFLKGINIENAEPFININLYGKISGTSKEEIFSIKLDEPDYSYIECLFPFIQNKKEDAIIKCKYNITKFPLIKTDKIRMTKEFPTIQNYNFSNLDFFNNINVGYHHGNYSIRFIGDDIIYSECLNYSYQVFTSVGSIKLNDNYTNFTNGQILKLNNLVQIDGILSNVSCRAFPTINNKYQLDCYLYDAWHVKSFPTIIYLENIQEFILIDYLHDYNLKVCWRVIEKKIEFQGHQPKCVESGKELMLTFLARTTGFMEDENCILNMDYEKNDNHINADTNCVIPFFRNGQDIIEINCILDTKKFPLNNQTYITLPREFPDIKDCKISFWHLINYDNRTYHVDCYPNYEMEFTNISKIEQKCKSKNEVILSLFGNKRNSINGELILTKESFNFSLSVIMDDNIKELKCEIYSSDGNSDYSQIDCDIEGGQNLKLYETIIENQINNKFIIINKYDKDININIPYCSNYTKFINFEGNMIIKPNLESSQLQLLLYSQTINFEKEETFRFNLDYPKYSYIDCLIPASNYNNSEYITCTLDTNKFPLTKDDNIILPSELKVNNYSLTKWNKITKELTNISCVPNYTNIFYSLETQNSITKCDDKGNNIITISGSIDSSQANYAYNFDIFGIVDSQYKSINCNLNISQNNQIICLTTGKTSANIFQTMGLDSLKKNNILIKIKHHLNYTLSECKPKLSSTLIIIIVVASIVVALIIAFVIFLIIRKKKKESQSVGKINMLINDVGELQEK